MSTAQFEWQPAEALGVSVCDEHIYDPAASTAGLHDAGYCVYKITGLDEIEELGPVWKNWAHSLNTDLDYYLYRVLHDRDTLSPYVLAVYKDGIPSGMLIGQIRWQRASAVVSFVNVPGPRMRVLEIKKDGRMGDPSKDVDRLLALEIYSTARHGEVDSVFFERLPLRSSLFREVHRLSGFRVKDRVPHVYHYSELSLLPHGERPCSFSRKLAHETRRKARRLERSFPGQIALRCFSDPKEIGEGLSHALRVAGSAWQNHLYDGLTDSTLTRATFSFLAQRGWLRIYILYIGETPSAFLVGQTYNRTFYCQYAGYDPKYGAFSVGSVVSARAFEHLAGSGVRSIDLGQGGQEHNRRLGCEACEEATVHLYSPTFRGVLANLYFGATQAVRRGGGRTRAGLKLDSASRVWRHYLLERQIAHSSPDRAYRISR